jgi:hypothetical protein
MTMRRNVPYAVLVPIVVVCVAVALMFWAMRGTSGDGTRTSDTTGNAYTRPNIDAVPAPTAPSNDTAADSGRISGPLNKSR